jgi:hypothetical protein
MSSIAESSIAEWEPAPLPNRNLLRENYDTVSVCVGAVPELMSIFTQS